MSGRNSPGIRLTIAACCLGLTATALQAETLTFGTGIPVTSLDPHFYNASGNNGASMNIFDRLVNRSPELQLEPGLATSWRTVSDTVWEFKLREGVTWHDGRPFTAADVAFTIARVPNVPNSPGGFAGFVRAIRQVEIVDPLTVRFHTANPAPLLQHDVAMFSVVARHAAEGRTTEDFNSGRAAIGTGPYRYVAFRPGERIEVARNPAWWGPRQDWETIRYRFIPNDAARTTALLAGDVDLIDQVPSSDLPRLRRESRVALHEIAGSQLIHLTFNFSNPDTLAHATDNDGRPLPRNPLMDQRVRRALSIAINRDVLVDRVMEGTATASGQWMPPGGIGYNPDIPVPPFDLATARRLLAEAGYPQGFRIALTTPNDRYPNDSRVALAIAQMWTRLGVQTEVDAVPFTVYTPRTSRQDFAIRLLGWGASSGEPSSPMVNLFSTYDRTRGMGAFNHGRYSNAAFDDLTRRVLSTMDEPARIALMQEAVKVATDDVAMIPLFMLSNIWASRQGIIHAARRDTWSVLSGTRLAP